MTTEYRIREATELDMLNLLSSMRATDARECAAQSGVGFHKNLRRVLKTHDKVYAGFHGDDLLCIFGLGGRPTALSDAGCIWMVGTGHLEKHAGPFARRSRKLMAYFMSQFDELFNFVDVRNVLAIKWLRWLGFEILEPVACGVRGEAFHPFRLRREK